MNHNTDIKMTQVESKQDIRATLLVNEEHREAESQSEEKQQRPRRYRPADRPPMALVRVFDDNQTSGELVRVRSDRFSIGSENADYLISHDVRMSPTHAEIVRHQVQGQWRWTLTDLDSRHGTFAKVREVLLRDEMQLRIGNQCLRFNQVHDLATLTRVNRGDADESIVLVESEYWLGRAVTDPGFDFLAGDDLLDEKDVYLSQTELGWTAQDAKSANGIWVRVQDVQLISGCQFQLGEQRFSFHVP